jgi:phospholipid/cholesterol/gamma-HCH transport system substrate-binding protein
LRDVQSTTNDARRTLNDVGRTVRNVERNPQQFMFGNRPSIPEYNGGR